MPEKTLKIGKLFRSFLVDRSAVDEKKRTVALSFSSETPVERWFGYEVLDHGKDAVDMTRLKRGGALLIDHDMRNQVGVIEEATIGADRVGRAVVRFGRSAKAEEIFQDVIDGIRSNVSVGYQIDEMVLEREEKDGPSTYRATRWTPYEVSLVSVPADINVGVGREAPDGKEVAITIPAAQNRASNPSCHSMEGTEDPMMEPMDKPEDCKEGEDCMNSRCASAKKKAKNSNVKETRTMEKCELCGADVVGGKCSNPKHDELVAARAKASSADVKTMEAERKKAISNLARANKIDPKIEEHWVATGASLEQISSDIIAILEERGKTNPQPASKIGLSERETQQYSLTRAINAMIDKDWTMAPFEREASEAVAKKLGRVPNPTRLLIPFEVLQRPFAGKRDLSTTSGGVGGYLVQTDNVGFIEALYNRAVVFKMGARRLSGLQGNVTIPRLSVGASATWLANQASTISEQTQTFVQVPLSPKNVGAYTEISRQLLLQSSPGVEGIISDDLSRAVALAADSGCLSGAGSSGEPDGIIDYDGVGSVTGTSLAYAGVLNFQEDVASSNVTPARGGYVTTPTVASLCMQRVKFTNTASPLWEGNIWDGTMAGFPAMTSNAVPAGDMIFGDWSEMVVGEWGVLELDVNPYAGFTAGIIGVRAIYTMDVAFRRPFAFSIAKSIT